MVVQRLEALRRRGAQPYMLLVGIVVGSLFTGLVVPFVAGETTRGADTLAVGAGGTDSGLDSGTTDVADPASGGTQASEVAGATVGGGPGARGRGGDGAVGSSAARSGPGAQGTSGDGGPSSSGVGGGSALGATDVGVTADEVKIGFLLLDTGSLSKIGVSVPGVDPEDQRQAFEAQLKEINDRGGFHGRKAVGVYEKFDVLSGDDMRRACLALGDKKVFAVVAAGGFQGPAILCLTEEGGTPLVNQGGHGTPSEYIRRSGGRLFSLYPESKRLMEMWVAELDGLGLLAGKKIGIVSQDHTNPGNTVVGGELIPALQRRGYTVTHHAKLPADQGAAASQIPVEVSQMQTKDVDLVMLTTSSIASAQFTQTADGQQFKPKYTFTDWASMNSDTSNQAMPASYNGTVIITTYRTGEHRIGIGETDAEKECRRIYDEGTGKAMAAKGENQHGLIQGNCTTLKALELGALNAGPQLTRASFSAGMQAVGAFPMTMWGGGAFAPGKFDAADLVRTAQWYFDCRCIKPTSDFRPSRV